MSNPLSKIADIYYGKSPQSVADQDGIIPVYGTGGIYCFANKSLFDGPAVIVARKGSLGKPHFASGPFWASDTTYAVVPKKGTNPSWLFRQLSNFELEKLNEATGVPSISREWLAKIEFKFQDPNHQKKIAAILETVDLAIEQTEALIAKYEQVKAGMMQDLFTRGLTAQGKLRPTRHQAPDQYQNTPIGWIPKEWEVKELVKLAHFQRGHDIVEAALESGEYPVISSGGIIGHHSCFTSKGPGVVIGRKGTIGKVHFSEGDYWAHDTSLYSTDFFDNEPKFIFHLCQWLDLARFGTKSGSPSLNRNDIHPLLVGRPACEEQKEITLRIEGMVHNCAALKSDAQKLRQQKSGLMHDLLTGKVAVKV